MINPTPEQVQSCFSTVDLVRRQADAIAATAQDFDDEAAVLVVKVAGEQGIASIRSAARTFRVVASALDRLARRAEL